jgi:hypothetical protein
MINQESFDAVAGARMGEHFVRPLYADYNFAQIPQTVRRCLGLSNSGGVPFGGRSDLLQRYDSVVLLFVDAFGWRFVEQYLGSAPALRRFAGDGMVAKITTQFPSTTAAHVTAIHTGLPPGASGVFEWFYYEPQLDAIIAPLLFSFAGDHERDTLKRVGARASTLYPTATLYQELKSQGVASGVFQHASYAFSPYTKQVIDGAQLHSYRTLPEALVNMTGWLGRQQGPRYAFLYFDAIDATCHRYGPESPQVAAEITLFLAALEQLLLPALERAPGRTLLLMTADHGQTALDPATAWYVNQQLPALVPLLRTDANGRPLAPAGSCRDMFLYVCDEALDDAQAMLRQALAGRAEVWRTSDMIAQGFFGTTTPSPEFLGRVGNLVVLPYRGEAVWWFEQDRFAQKHRGAHGGLTPDEMETVLLALPFGS